MPAPRNTGEKLGGSYVLNSRNTPQESGAKPRISRIIFGSALSDRRIRDDADQRSRGGSRGQNKYPAACLRKSEKKITPPQPRGEANRMPAGLRRFAFGTGARASESTGTALRKTAPEDKTKKAVVPSALMPIAPKFWLTKNSSRRRIPLRSVTSTYHGNPTIAAPAKMIVRS